MAPLGMQRCSLEAAAEAVRKSAVGPEQFLRLLTAEVGQTESEVRYRENKLELHRYEPERRRHRTPILVVYALVNRPYILDLQPDRSVVRRLLEAGFEVYLIDWGEPSPLDQSLTMADYVNRYVDNCVDVVCEEAGVDAVHVLGYCMGGTMSIMYAATHPERVRTLTLMATPVSLEGNGGVLEHWATFFDPDTVVEAVGNVPAELLAHVFALMDPVDNYVGKYVRLYENIEDDEFVENFSRMEQWIWDGVDVAGEAFREFVTEVYGENRLIEGEYRLGSERVDLDDIGMPVQQIVGEYDHIVPPKSSTPLNDEVGSDDERIVEFSAGHIGISVSSSAHEELWPDVCAWLAERDAGAPNAG
jgi:polyhydroxyalkanoate synthase